MKGCDSEFAGMGRATVVGAAAIVVVVVGAARGGPLLLVGRFAGAVGRFVGRFCCCCDAHDERAGEVEEADGDAAVDVDAASVPLAI